MPKRATYVFAFSGSSWRTSPDENWETEVYGPTGQEAYCGVRSIDGTRHRVYRCPDGTFRAVVG